MKLLLHAFYGKKSGTIKWCAFQWSKSFWTKGTVKRNLWVSKESRHSLPGPKEDTMIESVRDSRCYDSASVRGGFKGSGIIDKIGE